MVNYNTATIAAIEAALITIDKARREFVQKQLSARPYARAGDLAQEGVPVDCQTHELLEICFFLGQVIRNSYSMRKEDVILELRERSLQMGEAQDTKTKGLAIRAFLDGWVGDKKA